MEGSSALLFEGSSLTVCPNERVLCPTVAGLCNGGVSWGFWACFIRWREVLRFFALFPGTEADFLGYQHWDLAVRFCRWYFYLILLAYKDKKGPSLESHVSISSERPRYECQALLRLKLRIRVEITVKALKSSLRSSRNRFHIFMLSFTPSSSSSSSLFISFIRSIVLLPWQLALSEERIVVSLMLCLHRWWNEVLSFPYSRCERDGEIDRGTMRVWRRQVLIALGYQRWCIFIQLRLVQALLMWCFVTVERDEWECSAAMRRGLSAARYSQAVLFLLTCILNPHAIDELSSDFIGDRRNKY